LSSPGDLGHLRDFGCASGAHVHLSTLRAGSRRSRTSAASFPGSRYSLACGCKFGYRCAHHG
jgi:hypothetical protein